MKPSLRMALALIAVGCGTTSAAGPGANPSQPRRAPVESAVPEVGVEVTDRQADQPGVVIVATSPEHVELLPNPQDVFVRLPPRPPTSTARRARVMDGMLIGAAIGVVAGALFGAERDRQAQADPDAVRCDFCGAILDSSAFGAIGLGLGAAAAGIVNTFDLP